ncbi:MAG: sulfatase [Planctomycetes bacterium]|nr:sulfatase [Planctomycetota bacterium]
MSLSKWSARVWLPMVCLFLATAVNPEPARGQDDEDAGAARPNILFVFADDHATAAISAYGSALIKTPNIDRLAKQGIMFTNCHVTNAICAPSRAVILTGKHSHLNGIMTNGEVFDGAQQTFPKLMQTAGYQTAVFGKWHLKSAPTGFDDYEVLIGQGPYYNPTMRTPTGEVQYEGYTTDIITDRVLNFLQEERDPDKPFVVMYQHKAPHRNWQPNIQHLHLFDDVTMPEPPTLFDDYEGRASGAKHTEMTIANHMFPSDVKLEPPGYLTAAQLEAWQAAYGPKNAEYEAANLSGDDLTRWRYQRYIKDYLRAITSVDENLGRVLDYLDESGLADNTVVIYSSDQGFFLGEHGWYDKRWMYEESARMPFLVRWPAGIEKEIVGNTCELLVQNLDFAPTFLDLAGIEIPTDMQGLSLVPLLYGERDRETWRDSIYYHYFEYPAVHMVPRHYGVRTERYKLIRYYELDEWELFDLEKDPDELTSVYDDPGYEDVVNVLTEELYRLQKYYKDDEPEIPLAEIGQRVARLKAQRVKRRVISRIEFPKAPSTLHVTDLDLAGKPFTVEAKVRLGDDSAGVILAHGGTSFGFCMYVQEGDVHFGVRNSEAYKEVSSEVGTGIVTIVGSLSADGLLRVRIVESAGTVTGADAPGHFMTRRPSESALDVGQDSESAVGPYDGGDASILRGRIIEVSVTEGH